MRETIQNYFEKTNQYPKYYSNEDFSNICDDIKKEIIAFANCDGGKLYIGVQDDGTVVGLDDPDGVSLQISNMVRDAIKPDVTMFLHYKTIKEDEGWYRRKGAYKQYDLYVFFPKEGVFRERNNTILSCLAVYGVLCLFLVFMRFHKRDGRAEKTVD